MNAQGSPLRVAFLAHGDDTRTRPCVYIITMNENTKKCCVFANGKCISSSKPLRKKCLYDCGFCERHHGYYCKKAPSKRKALGDITNKKSPVCGGLNCSSQKPLCTEMACLEQKLCQRHCPCPTIKARETKPRGAKCQATSKIKIQILDESTMEGGGKSGSKTFFSQEISQAVWTEGHVSFSCGYQEHPF